jgi:DNA-binding NtrC family response regulator
MFHREPPEYRALVIENERDFRNELVYTVESLDMGVSVIDEVADYEEAMELLGTREYDLLITDINLTDASTFQVGVRDGTALAKYARETYDIPSIFLTAFADYDPDVVSKAAESDPIGFLRKQGSEISKQLQALLKLALRRLEQSRREHELMLQLESVVRHIGEALLYIDDHGLIIDFNDSAATLLGQPPHALADQHWDDVIRLDTGNAIDGKPLRALMNAGLSARLPCVALRRPDGSSLLASIYVALTEHLRQECTMLVIKDLQRDQGPFEQFQLEPEGSLAMFSLAPTAPDTEFDPVSQRISLLTLQSLLASRLRPGDMTHQPNATSLSLLLPNTDEMSAFAIVHSLVSDLEGEFAEQTPPLRLYAGLAHRDAKRSVYATIAAAVGALDRAQSSPEERVLAASSQVRVRDTRFEDRHEGLEFSFLSEAFKVTEKTFSAPMNTIRSTRALSTLLSGALRDLSTLSHFGLFIGSGRDHRQWFCLHQRASDSSLTPCGVDALPDQLISCLASQNHEETAPMSRLLLGNSEILIIALQLDDHIIAQVFMVSREPILDDRQFKLSELQIAKVWGRYVAQLLQQCADYGELKALDDLQSPREYNLYAIDQPGNALSIVRLLLQTDTPIALVAEHGMAPVQLLSHAAANLDAPIARDVRVVDPGDWACDSAELQLIQLLQTSADCLLLFRNPDQMPMELQAQLGAVMLTRQIAHKGATSAVPKLRFAVTLHQRPESLCHEGRLHERLASALGAGVVLLNPLREDPGNALTWARQILRAENQLNHSTRQFNEGALDAIASHVWPKNLEEMQERIRNAFGQSSRQTLGALDLGLYRLNLIKEGQDQGSTSIASKAVFPAEIERPLADVLNIASKLTAPPPIADWLEDELVSTVLDSYEGDTDPIGRTAEAFAVERSLLLERQRRAAAGAAQRHASQLWVNTRLGLRAWIAGYRELEGMLDGKVREFVLGKLLDRDAQLPREQALAIAGCSLEDYLTAQNQLNS